MVEELLLRDASFSEVLARVAYAYIRKRYADTGFVGAGPPSLLPEIIRELREAGLTQLQFWCAAYQAQWSSLYSLTLARDNFIITARSGRTWRSVAYPQYKGNRKLPPCY